MKERKIGSWEVELTENKAEIAEQIVHIHFDAKYKVNHFKVKSNEDGKELTKKEERKELNKIKTDERAGIFNNADLLKMHAYKDAIRRTENNITHAAELLQIPRQTLQYKIRKISSN